MDASSGGAKSTVPATVPVVEGVGGGSVDVGGGDGAGNIYIGHGGAITKVEANSDIDPYPVFDGAMEDGITVGGEENVIGGGGKDILSGGAELSINVDVGANLGEGGGEVPKGEKEKGTVPSVGGDDSSVVGSNISVDGASGGAEESGGANNGGGGEDVGNVSGGINISPIPLIPRRRLREILEHAQGECIILVYLLYV